MLATNHSTGFDDMGTNQLISTGEIARRMGYASRATFYRFARKHPLPAQVRRGFYRGGDVLEWFKSLTDDTAPQDQTSSTNTVAMTTTKSNILTFSTIQKRIQ